MRLTISNEVTNQILAVDLPGSLTIPDFKAYLEAETDIEPKYQILRHHGKSFQDSIKPLDDIGLVDDDLIVLLKLNSSSAEPVVSGSSNSSRDSASSSSTDANAINAQAEATRTQFLSNPTLKERLRQSNPHLHSLLNNPSAFKDAIIQSLQQHQGGSFPGFQGGPPQEQEELRRLQDNPDDPENQARIMELINQERIDENMQLAYDISPESFTSVNMLYIKIKVNNQDVQAFVDSGAQTTIISPKLAAKVGIDRLIDRRFQGEARGVGSQKIEGKIHSVPISIGDSNIEIPCSFIVLDTHVDLLFGLDMLRRHKCVIDLQKDSLFVGGHIEAKFIPELQIENDIFSAGGQGGQKLGGGGGSGFGGSIFSDPNPAGPGVIPANSTPDPSSSRKIPTNAAAEAAAKRQNVTGSSSSPTAFPDADIKQLTALGFSKQEAIFALEQCKGNVELAAALLFQ